MGPARKAVPVQDWFRGLCADDHHDVYSETIEPGENLQGDPPAERIHSPQRRTSERPPPGTSASTRSVIQPSASSAREQLTDTPTLVGGVCEQLGLRPDLRNGPDEREPDPALVESVQTGHCVVRCPCLSGYGFKARTDGSEAQVSELSASSVERERGSAGTRRRPRTATPRRSRGVLGAL